MHVVIKGTSLNVYKAAAIIDNMIYMDKHTRDIIRKSQSRTLALLKNKGDAVDLSLTTPYGPPAQDAYILEVPNDCVGLVIGKGGETIKKL